MAEYFKSKQVTVYPCSYRGKFNSTDKTIKQVDPEANMFTENTIRKSGLRINGRDTGLISFGKNQDKYDIEVLIHGYYFKITEIAFADLAIEDEEDEGNYTDTKYLQILTKPITLEDRKTEILASQNPDNVDYLDTDGDDENGDFVGLKIVETKPDTDYYYIKPCLLSSDKSELVANEEEKRVNVRHGAGLNSININLIENDKNVANGNGTITIGNNNIVNGNSSIAIGSDNKILKNSCLSLGNANNNTVILGKIIEVHSGSTWTDLTINNANDKILSALLQLTTYSNTKVLINNIEFTVIDLEPFDSDTWKIGVDQPLDDSFDDKLIYIAPQDNAVAIGTENIISGKHSFGFGEKNYVLGDYSTAIGYSNEIIGQYSYAEGYQTLVVNEAAHAEGKETTASGQGSHAEGYNTKATNHNAHSEGRETTASGYCSHAEGYETTADGSFSHAGGRSTTVSETNSFAHGNNLTADGQDQAVFGRFNKSNSQALFIIGDGTGIDDELRRNVFEVDSTGAKLTGDLTLISNNLLNTVSIRSRRVDDSYPVSALRVDFKQATNDYTKLNQNKISFYGYDYTDLDQASPFISKERVVIYNNEVAGTASSGTLEVNGGIKTTLGCYFGGNIITNGDITTTTGSVTATSFYATSDKRLKENIISYKPEKSILDLPVYKYDFINGNKNQIGCLAQDLQEICPELVESGKDGYLHIQESKLVYLLLEEVKELKKEVKELKDKR